jgi:hypothetical protein
MKIIDSDIGKFNWIEDWVVIPETPTGKLNGRTHGVVVTRSGEIIIFHQANPAVLFYSPEGQLLRSWGNYPGAHGLTLVEEQGQEFLWLVDETTTEVVKCTLDGNVIQRLEKPAHSGYEKNRYSPTWVAINEIRWGGNGDIWLADGYGASLVHRFNLKGHYLQTLDGTEGAGRFDCPHGLGLDTRRGEPELYVADRGNRRFQVYSVDGCYRRSFGQDFLTSPDTCIRMGTNLLVPELIAGITVLNEEDQPIAHLGMNAQANLQEGWPDHRPNIKPGVFNSPHSATADSSGNIYVVEWVTGGRVIKLHRQA